MRALTAREPLAAAGQRGALQQRRQHSRPLRCVTVAQAKAEGDSSQKKGAHLFVARRFGITVVRIRGNMREILVRSDARA